jgi:hypothetical protein
VSVTLTLLYRTVAPPYINGAPGIITGVRLLAGIWMLEKDQVFAFVV